MRLIRSSADSEDGFTLIELMVTVLLLTLVLGVVAGIMISTMNTEKSVRSVTSATNSGQLVVRTVEQGVRNSQTMIPAGASAPVPFSLTTPTASDQLLIVRTVGSAATISTTCSAWYYQASSKTLRYKTSSSAIPAPAASVLASWTLLADGISPISAGTVFSQNNQRLVIAFAVDAGKSPSVKFQTSIGSQTGMAGGATCF